MNNKRKLKELKLVGIAKIVIAYHPVIEVVIG